MALTWQTVKMPHWIHGRSALGGRRCSLFLDTDKNTWTHHRHGQGKLPRRPDFAHEDGARDLEDNVADEEDAGQVGVLLGRDAEVPDQAGSFGVGQVGAGLDVSWELCVARHRTGCAGPTMDDRK